MQVVLYYVLGDLISKMAMLMSMVLNLKNISILAFVVVEIRQEHLNNQFNDSGKINSKSILK